MSQPNETPTQEYIPLEQLTYEQALAELDQITQAMESTGRTLEDSLALYERGQALIRLCIQLLDQADLKVQQLSGDKLVGFDVNA